jgi:hypothetical protein
VKTYWGGFEGSHHKSEGISLEDRAKDEMTGRGVTHRVTWDGSEQRLFVGDVGGVRVSVGQNAEGTGSVRGIPENVLIHFRANPHCSGASGDAKRVGRRGGGREGVLEMI